MATHIIGNQIMNGRSECICGVEPESQTSFLVLRLLAVFDINFLKKFNLISEEKHPHCHILRWGPPKSGWARIHSHMRVTSACVAPRATA
jgi:hypothetical protein